jgi:hypothetical protein
MGSPAVGRINARHPTWSGLAVGALSGLLFLLDATGILGAGLAAAVIFTLIYGNGVMLRAYLDRGGVFRDERGC